MIQYEVSRITEKRFKEVDFSNIKSGKLLSNNGKGDAAYESQFWITYNDEGLIFCFKCADDIINCTMRGYNEPLYEEEVVEFFFVSGNDLHNYLELEWNGLNAVFCAKIHNDLNGHIKIALIDNNLVESDIKMIDGGWELKGFISKAIFDGEMKGEWAFNAYRIKRKEDKSMILMAYSPTLKEEFHKPEMFGKLIFKK